MEDLLLLFSPEDILPLLLLLTGAANVCCLHKGAPAMRCRVRELPAGTDVHNVNPRLIDAGPGGDKTRSLALLLKKRKLCPREPEGCAS